MADLDYNKVLSPYEEHSTDQETVSKYNPATRQFETKYRKQVPTNAEVGIGLSKTGGEAVQRPSSVYSQLYKEHGRLTPEQSAAWTAARKGEYQRDYNARKWRAIEKAYALERARLGEGVRIDYNKLSQKAGRAYEYDNPNENDLEILAGAMGKTVAEVRAEMKAFDIMQKHGIEMAIRKNEGEKIIEETKAAGVTPRPSPSPAPGTWEQVIEVKDPDTGKWKQMKGLGLDIGNGALSFVRIGGGTYTFKKGEWREPSGEVPAGEEKPVVTPKAESPILKSIKDLRMPGAGIVERLGIKIDKEDLKEAYYGIYDEVTKELTRKYYSKGLTPSLDDAKNVFNFYINSLISQYSKTGYPDTQSLKKALLTLSNNMSILKR